MTALLGAAEAAPPVLAEPRRPRVALAILPWLVPALVLLAALHRTGTPDRDVAAYAAYFAFGVVLPGTLVHRALRGSRGNLPEDLGLGAATGLLVILIGWALAAATGRQALLPGWPVLIIVLFAAAPRLRRHWRIAEKRPLPLRWSWIVAAALLALVLGSYPIWAVTPLPPVTVVYYQDLLYHLALVHEMTRSMPFQVPQLAGDTLRYHYLSDADMAAGSMITGVSPAVVLLRLWIVPIAGVAVFVVAAVTRDLSGKWWAGALGGAVAIVALPLSLGAATDVFGGTPVSEYSPSQTYALPLLGLLLSIAVDVLRGRRLSWAWAVVLPLALACAGAKSSALPPFVAGLLLALIVVGRRHRDRLRATLLLFGLTVVAMLIGLKIFAGGGAGTLGLQPFAILYWVAPYKLTVGSGDVIDGSRSLPLGVEQAGLADWAFIAGLVVWWLAMQSPRLLGLIALGTRRTRGEPAAWLLGGMITAGAGGAWLLWHPSASQVYFYMCAVPFGTALTAWLLADQARHWRPVVAGVLAGGLWALFAPHTARPADIHSRSGWMWALVTPVLWTLAAAAVVAAVGLLIHRLVTRRYAWRALPVAALAAVLGAALAGSVGIQVRESYEAVAGKASPAGKPERAILEPEMRAALWLDAHAGRDDVVATNVHCQPLTWRAACDSRAFWVAGLGGRRTLVESWGYSDQTVAEDGVDGKRYSLQPAPYPDRFALNQRVFAKAAPADLAELRDKYHVRWLLADSRAAGGVAPGLARIAALRYAAGPVTVYRLT